MLMDGRYEIQVLDSHASDTYADGQAGAIYGQYPPLSNASRAPGEWNAYDIYFRRPRFGPAGEVVEPARFTVVHNGILIQNNEEVLGPTSWLKFSAYQAHADELPIQLQDHGQPVRYRNIWVRRLPERPAPPAGYRPERTIRMSPRQLDRYVGSYVRGERGDPFIRIARRGDRLVAHVGGSTQEVAPLSPTEFTLEHTAGRLLFDLDARGAPTGVTFTMGGARMSARRARE